MVVWCEFRGAFLREKRGSGEFRSAFDGTHSGACSQLGCSPCLAVRICLDVSASGMCVPRSIRECEEYPRVRMLMRGSAYSSMAAYTQEKARSWTHSESRGAMCVLERLTGMTGRCGAGRSTSAVAGRVRICSSHVYSGHVSAGKWQWVHRMGSRLRQVWMSKGMVVPTSTCVEMTVCLSPSRLRSTWISLICRATHSPLPTATLLRMSDHFAASLSGQVKCSGRNPRKCLLADCSTTQPVTSHRSLLTGSSGSKLLVTGVCTSD